MESTIDFFRFREREDFIALSQGGDSCADAIAVRHECQSVSLGPRAPSRALSAKREARKSGCLVYFKRTARLPRDADEGVRAPSKEVELYQTTKPGVPIKTHLDRCRLQLIKNYG
jgi:hypothetical protein